MPCSHTHEHQDSESGKTINHCSHNHASDLPSNSDSEDDTDNEPCSPFCVCQCYFVPNITLHKLALPTLLITQLETPQDIYISNYTYNPFEFYWNPPV